MTFGKYGGFRGELSYLSLASCYVEHRREKMDV